VTEKPDAHAIARFADACARAYGFTGEAQEQVRSEIERAYLEGGQPDWDSIRERAGREINDADFRDAGLSQEEIDAVRAHYAVFHVMYTDEEAPLQTFSPSHREEALACAHDLAQLGESKGRKICVVQSVAGMEEAIRELQA
jgi:hypothetical protein